MFRLARTLGRLAAAGLCLSALAGAGEGATVTAAPTHLLVVDKVTGQLVGVDLASGETASARVGAGAEGLALTPDGVELWVGSNDEHEVHVLRPADLETLDVLPTCRRPIRVAPVGERRMAVTCHADSEVLLFDAVSHERVGSVRLPVGSAPVGTLASPDGARLFVAATATGTVYEIDVGSSTIVRTFVLGGEPDGMALVTLPGSR